MIDRVISTELEEEEITIENHLRPQGLQIISDRRK